ncbi:MAG TPA: PfkB family carbohydrate kinase [Stellaceae bacterium]|nr:PfkB family carbohydrate kinase [Stellaceae bacterium]
MILVFGSLNVDVLVPVPRLPAPGETVLGGDYRLLPGGKGANQALAARRAGAAVAMAGAVGGDNFAAVALTGLRAAGVDLALVRRVAAPTGCALIMVAAQGEQRGENLIAVAAGANRAAAASDVPDTLLTPGTTLVCQMEVPAEENWALLRRARTAGTRTILNLAPAAPVPPDAVADIDILVANRGEAAVLGADPAAIARHLRRAFVVTHDAAGSIAYRRGGGQIDTPALPIDPADTTGAGDTFVGVLAAALDRGLALAPALRRASAAAGLACLDHGAQSAMPDAVAIDAAVGRLPAR